MKRNYSTLLLYAIVYFAVLMLFQRYFQPAQHQQRPPVAQATTQYRQEFDQLLKQASDNSLSRPEREKRYQDALRVLDRIAGLDPQDDVAFDARFDKAALLEEMAQLDAQSTHYLDQAEQIYKELKKTPAQRTAMVSLNDEPPQQINVHQEAERRLDAVLLARDERYRSHILYKVLDGLVAATGRISYFSYWFALLLLVVVIKFLLYPFSKRQYKSMQDMQRVAPLIKEVQEKMKGKPAPEIQQAVMKIYKDNNVNMAAGCLPAVVQMAALIPLYYMVRFYEFQFRSGTFFWIGSALSHEHPRYLATSLAASDLPLLVLYLLSMFLTSKLTPPPADPQQAQTQRIMMYMMPLMFGWFMYSAQWPAAFTFYWLVLNLVSTAQQYYILKKHPAAPLPATQSSPNVGSAGNGRNGRDGRSPGSPKLDSAPRPRRKAKR